MRRPVCAALIVVKCMLPLPVAEAQTQAVGVKGGLSSANVNLIDDEQQRQRFLKRRLALMGGLFTTVPFAEDRFALQLEGMLSQKGSRLVLGDFEQVLELTYFEVPVLARINLTPAGGGGHIHVFSGAAFGFMLSAQEVFDDEAEDVDELVRGDDFSLVFGGGFEYRKLVIDLRYTRGLVDIARRDGRPMTTNAIGILAGVKFR
jgi:Outer membrane protein beta-barrel domain